jgi:hypothetical protein
MSGIRYHKDKFGNSLKNVRGYRIKDDSGELFELFGTGAAIEYPFDLVNLWSEEQKLVVRRESQLTLVKGFWASLFT